MISFFAEEIFFFAQSSPRLALILGIVLVGSIWMVYRSGMTDPERIADKMVTMQEQREQERHYEKAMKKKGESSSEHFRSPY